MKSRFTGSLSLACAALVASGTLAFPQPSEAGNPFKKLHAKVKQKVTKVKTAVHPKRVGGALLNGTTNAVEWMNPGPRLTGRSRAVDYAAERREAELHAARQEYYHARRPETESRVVRRYAEPEVYRFNSTSNYQENSANQPGRQPRPPVEYQRDTRRVESEEPLVTEEERRAAALSRYERERPAPDPREELDVPEKSLNPSDNGRNGDIRKRETAQSSGDASSKPAPATAPVKREDLPFGQPVVGKAGYVYSPYAKDELVDVTDIPSGTRVECPYTKKHFRVP